MMKRLLAVCLSASLIVLLVSTAAMAQTAQPNRIEHFDLNANCSLENGEFFALVDAWGQGELLDVLLFLALDLWIDEAAIPNCINDPGHSERPPQAICEVPGQLRTAFQGDNAWVPVVRGSTEVDLFISDESALPAGTNFSLSISTNAQELRIAGGGFFGIFTTSTRFTNTNANYAFGSAATSRDGVLSPGVPFASFRLQALPVGVPTYTFVSIGLSINVPNCRAIQKSTSFEVGIGAASTSSYVEVPAQVLRVLTGVVFQAHFAEPIRVEIFDLSGQRLFRSTVALKIYVNPRALNIPNGTYVVVIHKPMTDSSPGRILYSIQ